MFPRAHVCTVGVCQNLPIPPTAFFFHPPTHPSPEAGKTTCCSQPSPPSCPVLLQLPAGGVAAGLLLLQLRTAKHREKEADGEVRIPTANHPSPTSRHLCNRTHTASSTLPSHLRASPLLRPSAPAPARACSLLPPPNQQLYSVVNPPPPSPSCLPPVCSVRALHVRRAG